MEENKVFALSDAAREARNRYMKTWREKNREKIRAYDRAWSAANKDKVAEKRKRYWEKKANEMGIE